MISGLIIGIMVIGIFTSLLGKVFMESERQNAKQQFSEIYARANTLCIANVGEEDFYELKIPGIVEGIYVTDDAGAVFPEDIEDKMKLYETSDGTYLCMKITDERHKCQKMVCKIDMNYFAQKKTVLSLVDKILKRSGYTTFPVYFEKFEGVVSIRGN